MKYKILLWNLLCFLTCFYDLMMLFKNIGWALIKYLGGDVMISDEEKAKIKDDIVNKVNSVLEKKQWIF